MLSEIIAELQSLGVRVEQERQGRNGGAGPAEGVSLLIEGIPVNVPLRSPYVKTSPFKMGKEGDALILFKEGCPLFPVSFIKEPSFYRLATEEGVPYRQIALLHGKDCLATSVLQTCLYWHTEKSCRFCGIELSLERGQTLPLKTPRQLAQAALAARDLDAVEHVVLTTGTGSPPGQEISLLAEAARAIKKETGLPIHAQFQPPPGPDGLHALKEAGVDTVGIHVETFDQEVLRRIAPGKAAIGLERYEETWKKAVDLFGPNQVSSFLIAGLGENPASLLSGTEFLADLGVYPFVVPFRPIPGSLMSSALPPDPEIMKPLYEKSAILLAAKGLFASKSLAGCVRCGACSALPAYEKEAAPLVCHPARTGDELGQAMEIRKEVFVREQGLFETSDRDENDWKSIHLVAKVKGEMVGTVRVFPSHEGHGHWIGGRLAVRRAHRSTGAGEWLVREAVSYVKRHGCGKFTAHIQEKNVPFFLKLGWRTVGPPETYHGRLHQWMEADLKLVEEFNSTRPNRSSCRLGAPVPSGFKSAVRNTHEPARKSTFPQDLV